MNKPIPKIYRTKNWSSYNQALINRGNLTIWFDSKTPPPFSSQNSNLIELPFHVRQASFEELAQAGKLLAQFHVIFSSDQKNLTVPSSQKQDEDLEDW